jgi:WD40 repeat protein/serine/threonine protein kinase
MDEASIFLEALKKPSPGERTAFLDRACGGNDELRRSVELLLRAHDKAGGFLADAPAPVGVTVDQTASETLSTIIGPYRLIEPIGEGGMGSVWMAQQTEPVKRLVAVKLIKAGMDSKQVIARFEAERQALALMDHPHIAHVFDGGATASGRPYFVMELVRGVPITAFCDQNQLGVRERLGLFVDVCQAVQHAHQKGIIHRDLKPSNVLVTLHDDRPVVKVIDFGVAKATGQQLTDRTLITNFAQMIGTPLYMSPEQAQMSGLDVDTRSDVYSLGVLLYELLTGTTPFDRERLRTAGYDEIRRIMREEEAARPSARISTLGEAAATVSASRRSDPKKLSRVIRGELDWVVMKALEKDRNRRYESASAFAADVQRYLHDEPVQAHPPSVRYRLGKYLRRNKGPLLAGSVISLALFGGLIGASYGSVEARKQKEVAALWQQAEVARGEAETARDGEAKAKREAEDAREKLAAVEYGRTMQVAHQEWRDNNLPVTLALLDSTRADLRGWEWRYVSRLCRSELLTLQGHTDTIRSASFSPDGARVVTASSDSTARVWDARTGAEVLTFRGHKHHVWSASFSPDGARVVTAGSDKTARVWDAKTGAGVLTLRGHTVGVGSASFSPDGARVVTASGDETAKVWDAKTGAVVLTLRGHTHFVKSASFGPDGARVVTASYDRTARVWDAKTGAEVLTLRHTGQVLTASFSPDGARVVTASYGCAVKVWDAKTGAEVLALQGHTDTILSVSFSTDGARIVTGSEDRTARLWDAGTGAEVLTLKHAGHVVAASLSPDGARVVTASGDRTAKVWDARTGVEPLTLRGHTGLIRSASFSPDGARVVTGGNDGSARVWDAKTGAMVLTLKHAAPVMAASLSPDGSRVLTGGGDSTAKVWDARTGAEVLTLRGHTFSVTAGSFSPDGARVVTASGDETAKVWDAKTGAEVLTLRGHTMTLTSASFSPDGARIVTASFDKTARVWDARTGAEVLALRGHTKEVRSASFSPDGSRVVTASSDETAKVWDAKTGAEVLTLRGHMRTIWWASFSPDGVRVVTAGNDWSARVWDARTGAEVLTLKGHLGPVTAALWSADGSRLLTVGDTTVKVWDATPVPKAEGIGGGQRASPP